MKIESILNAQEITELAKERFKEERATDHLEGWFLAKEIMRECDEKFKEDVVYPYLKDTGRNCKENSTVAQ